MLFSKPQSPRMQRPLRPWSYACLRRTGRRADERGSIPIEGLFGGMLLLSWLMIAFQFYDAFRSRAVVNSATYTIADLISRQSGGIGPNFVNGSKSIFDMITRSSGDSQSWMRVSIITCSASANTTPCDGTTKKFSLSNSYATGSGHTAVNQAMLNNMAAHIPVMSAGDTAVIVESYYTYHSIFDIGDKGLSLDSGKSFQRIGLPSALRFSEFVVTRPRGARTVWSSSL